MSPWGGLKLMSEMLDKMNILEKLRVIGLPEQGSNRGYPPEQLIIGYWISLWCGASALSHTELLRQDQTLAQIFHFKQMPGHRAYMRYFKKFSQSVNQDCFSALYRWFFERFKFDNLTLDFDSTVITRYGEQQGVAKGYNPSKPGRVSHHPLMAFLSDHKMVANCWLRPGNTSASNNFASFLQDTLDKLALKRVGLVRADSGFCNKQVIEILREQQIHYIIAARLTSTVKYSIIRHKAWTQVTEGIDVAETYYQADSWSRPERLIIVRQECSKRKKAVGKLIKKSVLFPQEYDADQYRYSCYITDLDLPASVVWQSYRGRAEAENRIKELKYDFAMDMIVQKDFWGTEAMMNMAVMAYNLMSLFRIVVINSPKKHMLKTIRMKFLAIPGYIQRHAGKKTLKLALALKHRPAFLALWKRARDPNISI